LIFGGAFQKGDQLIDKAALKETWSSSNHISADAFLIGARPSHLELNIG